MVMAVEPRDAWSKFDVITKAISILLLPVVLFVASNMYTAQQRTANENVLREQQRADGMRYKADRLAMMVKSLSSENERERLVALQVLESLVISHQVLTENLRAVLENFASNGSAAEQELATAIIKRHYAQEELASGTDVRPRLYLDICDENQRQKANEAKSALEREGFAVLAIGKVPVGPPETTQVRYFHSREQGEARKIADALTRLGLKNAKAVYFSEYEHDESAPPRQYEVRFSVVALDQ